MNVAPDLEGRVAAWLDAQANAEGADLVLDRALERASHVGQERTRRTVSLPSLPRLARPIVVATAVGVAIASVAVTAIPPMPLAANARISGVWPTGPDVAFTATVPADTPDGLYWRVASYDTWSTVSRTWTAGDDTEISVAAGASILEVTNERIAPDGRTVTVTIVPNQESALLVAPGIPVSVDQATKVATAGRGGPLIAVSLSRPTDSYQVTAVQAATSDTAKLAARLRAAGTAYPADIRARYAKAPDAGELGASSSDFLAAIRAKAGDNPYDIAANIVETLRRPDFVYATDTRDVDCGRDGFTECFLRVKRGYCMYFSTAMIMLLRQQGIPARIVMGYLPGERNGPQETVRTQNVHAWVEVFFPEAGWVPFDPTPRVPPATQQLP